MTWPTKDDFVDGDVLTAAQVNNIGTNLNEADPTGITDGYLLTADGAGSMGWEAPPAAGAYTTLASGSLSGSTLDLQSISGAYTDLYLILQSFRPSTTATIGVRINALSGTSYTSVFSGIYDGSNRLNIRNANKDRLFHYAEETLSSNASFNQQLVVKISNYADTGLMISKPVLIEGVALLGNGNIGSGTTYGSYTDTESSGAINRIQVLLSTGAYSTGTYVLYGVK